MYSFWSRRIIVNWVPITVSSSLPASYFNRRILWWSPYFSSEPLWCVFVIVWNPELPFLTDQSLRYCVFVWICSNQHPFIFQFSDPSRSSHVPQHPLYLSNPVAVLLRFLSPSIDRRDNRLTAVNPVHHRLSLTTKFQVQRTYGSSVFHKHGRRLSGLILSQDFAVPLDLVRNSRF